MFPLLFMLKIIPKHPDAVPYDRIREVYGPTGIRTLNCRLNNSKKVLTTESNRAFLRHCKETVINCMNKDVNLIHILVERFCPMS